jgi:outer membrane lipoprotein carrier protein
LRPQSAGPFPFRTDEDALIGYCIKTTDHQFSQTTPERHASSRVALHMKKLTYLAATAFAVLPMTVRAQSADAVLDRAVAAYARLNSMRADFTQTLTNPLTGNSQTTSGTILRKKPNLLSITFDSGDRVAADGSTLWVYLPSSVPGQVMKMPYTGSNASTVDPAEQFLNSPRTRFTVTSSGTATLGGRKTHAVTLVPKRANANFTNAKVWIEHQTVRCRDGQRTQAPRSDYQLHREPSDQSLEFPLRGSEGRESGGPGGNGRSGVLAFHFAGARTRPPTAASFLASIPRRSAISIAAIDSAR